MLTLAERVALKMLRQWSPRWRAKTDLFVDPYRQWIEWQSGLGEASHLLYGLARLIQPKVIVEIGSARGVSTCTLALACAENGGGHVYAIDPHQLNEWTDVGTKGGTLEFLQERLHSYRLDQFCTIIRKPSGDAAVTWNQTIDLLFIDGDHTLEGVRKDFEGFAPWVRDDGLVVVHDAMWERAQPWTHFKGESWYREEMGVPEYLQDLQAKGYQTVSFGPAPGLTLMHPKPGPFDLLQGRAKAATRPPG
jgi:predicted O-methyltransferase YrrM